MRWGTPCALVLWLFVEPNAILPAHVNIADSHPEKASVENESRLCYTQQRETNVVSEQV